MKVDEKTVLVTDKDPTLKELVSPGHPLSNKSLEDNYMNEEEIITKYQEKQNEKKLRNNNWGYYNN